MDATDPYPSKSNFERLDLSLKFDEISLNNFNKAKKAHQEFFKWNNKDQEDLKDINETLAAIEFTKTGIKNKQDLFEWKNPTQIDVTGIPSRQRILIIRDITQHLKQEGRAYVVQFKLNETNFIIKLNPTDGQPGNGLFAVGKTNSYRFYTHEDMQKFTCFKDIKPHEINTIVTAARQKGTNITREIVQQTIQARNEDIEERVARDSTQTKIAEELTFYMLEFDFEVARRLQPQNKKCKPFDSLPIGIGIAIQHHFQQSEQTDEEWVLFDPELFFGDNRETVLKKLIEKHQKSKTSSNSLTKDDWVDLLNEKFGSPPQNETATASCSNQKSLHLEEKGLELLDKKMKSLSPQVAASTGKPKKERFEKSTFPLNVECVQINLNKSPEAWTMLQDLLRLEERNIAVAFVQGMSEDFILENELSKNYQMIDNSAELALEQTIDGFVALIVLKTLNFQSIPPPQSPVQRNVCNQRHLAGIQLLPSNVSLFCLYQCPSSETIHYLLDNNQQSTAIVICTFSLARFALENIDLYPLFNNLQVANREQEEEHDCILYRGEVYIDNWDRDQENNYIRFSIVNQQN